MPRLASAIPSDIRAVRQVRANAERGFVRWVERYEDRMSFEELARIVHEWETRTVLARNEAQRADPKRARARARSQERRDRERAEANHRAIAAGHYVAGVSAEPMPSCPICGGELEPRKGGDPRARGWCPSCARFVV